MLPFNLQPLLHHINNPLLPEHNPLYSSKSKRMDWLPLMSRSIEVKMLPFNLCLFLWFLTFAIYKKNTVLQDHPIFSCRDLPVLLLLLCPLRK